VTQRLKKSLSKPLSILFFSALIGNKKRKTHPEQTEWVILIYKPHKTHYIKSI